MKNLISKTLALLLAFCIVVPYMTVTPARALATPEFSEEYFPDAEFRDFLLDAYDTGGDQKIIGTEWDAMIAETTLVITQLDITDITGIEYFTKLEYLTVTQTDITSLDLSQNPTLIELNCSRNALVELNVSGLKDLELLNCSNNKLTELDVTTNTSLDELDCSYNRLTSLDLSKNTSLVSALTATGNEKVIDGDTIDVSKLPGFGITNVSTWTNATANGTVVKATNISTPITYSYTCGNSHTVQFTLTPTYTVAFKSAQSGKTLYTAYVLPNGTVGEINWTVPGYSFNWTDYATDLINVTENKAYDLPAIQYTIAYELYGGTNSAQNPATYTVEDDIQLASPSKAGFAFDGWYSDSGFTKRVTSVGNGQSDNISLYAKWTAQSGGYVDSGSGNTTPIKTIEVSGVEVSIFENNKALITAKANMDNAFSNSVEVRLTDDEDAQNAFYSLLGSDLEIFSFDMSLYVKNTGTKTQPAEGYSVTITLPLPEELWESRESVSVAHIENGRVVMLKSALKQINGVWCIVFETNHFSPYALLVGEVPEHPFTDIDGHWAYKDILYAYKNSLFSGISESTFSPDIPMTRAMLVTVLWRIEGEPVFDEILMHANFADVVQDSYYEKAVGWAAKNEIVGGYGEGFFGPNDNVTREQFATILYRYAQYKGIDVSVGENTNILSYNDALDVSEYAFAALQWACGEGIITGKPGDLLDPQGSATRAEVAVMLHRFLEK